MTDNSDDPTLTDRILIEKIPNLLCIKDGEGRWLQAKASYLKLFNLQDIDYFNKTDYFLSQEPDAHSNALRVNATLEKKAWKKDRPVKDQRKLISSGGDKTFEMIRTPVFDENGRPFKLFVTGRTIQRSEEEKTKLKLLSSIFKCSHLNLLIFDQNFNIVYINDAFSSITGLSMDEVQDKPLSFVFVSEKISNFTSVLTPDSDRYKNGSWYLTLICFRKNSDNFPVIFNVSPIEYEAGEVTHYCATISDVTQQKLKAKRILHMTRFDDLTGLGNRMMFLDNLSRFISAAKRHKLYAVIFFIDLDRFKSINDSLGHDAGDELLKDVGERLKTIMRKQDIVARFSGDEFALAILNEKSHGEATYTASLIAKKVIDSLSRVFDIKGHHVNIGSSIGITIFPEDGLGSEALLKNADLAMYEAKNQGRNNYQFYKKEFSNALNDKLNLENDLRKAIENNELRLFYQPQYTTRDRTLWGAEVLIRWFYDPNNQNKMIPPDYFIPIAEDTGIIIEIGKWILEKSCQQLASWIEQGYPIRRISVNISARQFMDTGFLESIDAALRKSGLPSEYLELEITESMLIGDTKLIQLKLERLKKKNIKIALDDFGTGYSSLSYLSEFPIDILKIDQCFIREMEVDSKNARIVCAIIEMGHSLKQKIIAEGVEDIDQLNFLCDRGCDIIQGYYFSQPLPVYKMTTLLQNEAIDS
jgi:diguanylate cyclase (GGDEF)-like protein/PAS domain S-box-containing protein